MITGSHVTTTWKPQFSEEDPWSLVESSISPDVRWCQREFPSTRKNITCKPVQRPHENKDHLLIKTTLKQVPRGLLSMLLNLHIRATRV